MQDKFASSRLALDERTAQLEQLMNRVGAILGKVPPEIWKRLATLILVIWLAHSFAQLFWLVMPDPKIPEATATSIATVAGQPPADGETVDVAALKELDSFGKMAEVAVDQTANTSAQPVVDTDVAETQLNLVLRGIIGSSDEASSRAIIANGAQQDVYGPGASLPVGNGVTLAKVLEQRVILNNNGRYESLWLYKEGETTTADIQTSFEPDPEFNSRSAPYDSQPSGAPGRYSQPMSVDKSGGDGSGVSGNPMGGGDPAARAAQSLSDVVAMSIHREGGQLVGYKIRPGRNAEQFAALGLQADDIVTAVNGTPLTSPGKVMEIYKNMSNATSASLEIKRGGNVLSIDVVLQ